jgi:transcriptional regulator with XRE-family HTH domain
MTADDLIAWRKRHKLTQPQAAECFGLSLRGWQKREAGGAAIARETELACRYLDQNPAEMFPNHTDVAETSGGAGVRLTGDAE